MAKTNFIWTTGSKGNIAHIARHGLIPGDVENAFHNATWKGLSNSTNLPALRGPSRAGNPIFVVYYQVDSTHVRVVTAY